MTLALDHLAVAASSLTAGVEHVKQILDVNIPFGGQHPTMGTHNHLMKMGDTEFLEVIAIDPDATPPTRPRWFDLDNFGQRPAGIETWLLRTDDIDATLAQLPAELGDARVATRGDLRWRIAVPADGSMYFDGAFPTILEWPMRPYPGSRMAEFNCAIETLRIQHPAADDIAALLKPLFDDKRVSFSTAPQKSIRAGIRTPSGIREL